MNNFCLNCKKKINTVFLNLGKTPIANNFPKTKKKQKNYKLEALVCDNCFLVQVDPKCEPKDFFKDYSYQSGHSTTWIKHCKKLSSILIKKFKLNKKNTILEIASNDGTQLDIFKKKGFKNLIGVDPSQNLSKLVKKKNIKVFTNFFSEKFSNTLLKKNIFPKIIIANNVIAHIPDINDFCKGISKLLQKSNGVASIEFHYLLELIKNNQFDSIYHEHHFYHSLYSLNHILKKNNLKIFDFQKINTHGGSIRIFVCFDQNKKYKISQKVKNQINYEIQIGINKIKFYKKFKIKIDKIRNKFKNNFSKLLKKYKNISGYGAAAKATTFLNFMKIKKNNLKCIYDKNPYKQGRFIPGSLTPIKSHEDIINDKPDAILILIWNLKTELKKQLNFTKKWKCKIISSF